MICKKCNNTLNDGEKFCSACGLKVETETTNIPISPVNVQQEIQQPTGTVTPVQSSVSEASQFVQINNDNSMSLKNKSMLGIIIGIVIIVLIIGSISLYFLFKPNYNLDEAFKNMMDLKSYKVVVNTEASVNFSKKAEKQLRSEHIIEPTVEKTTEEGGTSYFYNNKEVDREEYKDGEIWYYNEHVIPVSYKGLYKDFFGILNKYDYKKEKNRFIFVNKDYIDEDEDEVETLSDLKYDLEQIEKNLFVFGDYHFNSFSEEYGKINVEPVLGGLEIHLEGDMIDKIVLSFIAECSDENNERLECSDVEQDRELYKVIIEFSEFNKAKVELPKTLVDDLKITTAGEWVGRYYGSITCPDGKTYDEYIDLSNSLTINNNIYWRVDNKVYNCEGGYYNDSTAHYYTYKDNIIKLYDLFREETVAEFILDNNTLIEKNDKGEIISQFKKENE